MSNVKYNGFTVLSPTANGKQRMYGRKQFGKYLFRYEAKGFNTGLLDNRYGKCGVLAPEQLDPILRIYHRPHSWVYCACEVMGNKRVPKRPAFVGVGTMKLAHVCRIVFQYKLSHKAHGGKTLKVVDRIPSKNCDADYFIIDSAEDLERCLEYITYSCSPENVVKYQKQVKGHPKSYLTTQARAVVFYDDGSYDAYMGYIGSVLDKLGIPRDSDGNPFMRRLKYGSQQ